MGDSHVFQGNRKGDQSSQADYKGGGDYRKLTLKESGGGGEHQNTTEPKGVTGKIKLWHNQTPPTPCKAINDDQSLKRNVLHLFTNEMFLVFKVAFGLVSLGIILCMYKETLVLCCQ